MNTDNFINYNKNMTLEELIEGLFSNALNGMPSFPEDIQEKIKKEIEKSEKEAKECIETNTE